MNPASSTPPQTAHFEADNPRTPRPATGLGYLSFAALPILKEDSKQGGATGKKTTPAEPGTLRGPEHRDFRG